jgi:DNA polymerase-3 subunit epsilon
MKTPTNHPEYQQAIDLLTQSGEYRVIQKYQKPDFYHQDDSSILKKRGIFLDVESTGSDYKQDKIIELGMAVFEYAPDGRIFSIVEEFCEFQDPGIPISEFITQLTGITDEMVQGQAINIDKVKNLIQSADIIISHNADFDRKFMEAFLPSLPLKPWGCSLKDIHWKNEKIESAKQEYLAYKFGFYYEGHRAISDCLAGIHILSMTLPVSQEKALGQLLNSARKNTFKLWATRCPFEQKDVLKSRGYRWHADGQAKYKAWALELSDELLLKNEITFLWHDVYSKPVKEPIDVFNAYSRYSMLPASPKQQELDLIEKLYQELTASASVKI